MSTLDPDFKAFLDDVDLSGAFEDRCEARNGVLDERVTPQRAVAYRGAGAASAHGNVDVWHSRHNDYVHSEVSLPWATKPLPVAPRGADEVAATFRAGAGNETVLANDLMLVRMVRLPSPRHVPSNYAAFISALRRNAGRDKIEPKEEAAIDAGLYLWQSGLASTLAPRWVGLWLEVRELFGEESRDDDPNWANRLRDRLGLPIEAIPRPVEVMLLRYRVGELPTAAWRPGQAMVTVPSLLDGPLCAQFCPAPAQDAAGRAVNLEGKGDAPNREYLHPPVLHRAKHVYRVGEINASPLCDLPTARELHLKKVRVVSQRPDYGRGTN